MNRGGKPLRNCLPSKEREEYVAHLRRLGFTVITERQRNRYIDEFLRFCFAKSNHLSAQKITERDIRSYAGRLARTSTTVGTARTKLTIVLQWCKWLKDTDRIKTNPAETLKPKALVGDAGESDRD